ncbi:hypothetical protein F5876DRAFT_84619 [Lentinula aff. lateritia]|uniref:Uncharacterized protein n=1 Tax=Lentinula aff. lateritia TaxID=2804960 RepID=A0ACC1TG68_9AGAR|nr:hypothetical protein F5876DRAFT_84619 [Lentinula aff. lateritia]
MTRRRKLADAAAARGQQGTSPSEVLVSPWRPVAEIRRGKDKGKGEARPEPVGGDLGNGDDGNDSNDDEEDQAPCEQCKNKKLSYQMQAGKRSSIILKKEGGSRPAGEQLAILESQMARVLTNDRQLWDGQTRAHSYHYHIVKKLDWLIMDAAKRRSPPEVLEAGPSELLKKRRKMVDSDEKKKEWAMGEDDEEDGGEEREPALVKVCSEKGKE